jgi:outer membrane protein
MPVVASGMALAPAAFSQGMAVVNTQAAILATAKIQATQTRMEAEFKPRQEEIQKLQQELQGIQEQLQKMAGKLTPQAERDLQVEGQRKQRDLQRKTEDLESDVTNRRNDVLAQVGREMTAIIQKLAQEKGYDVVFDASNTLYVKPALDITKDVAEAYDKAYPAK